MPAELCRANDANEIGADSVLDDTSVATDSFSSDSDSSSPPEGKPTTLDSATDHELSTPTNGQGNESFWMVVLGGILATVIGGLILLVVNRCLGWRQPKLQATIVVILPVVAAVTPGPLDDLLVRLIIGIIASVGVARLTKSKD